MTTDRRRRQFVAVPVDFLQEDGRALYARFGAMGVVAWLGFRAACQAAPVQGQLRWSTETEARALLGLTGYDLVDLHGRRWTIEDLFGWTGRRHWTLTRRARADGVRTTVDRRWEELQPRAHTKQAAAEAPAARGRRAATPASDEPDTNTDERRGRDRRGGGGVAGDVSTRRQRGADAVQASARDRPVDNAETAGQAPAMRRGAAAATPSASSTTRQRGADEASTTRQRMQKPQVTGQKYGAHLTSPHLTPDHLRKRGGQGGATTRARDPGGAAAPPPGPRAGGGQEERPPLTLVAGAAPPSPPAFPEPEPEPALGLAVARYHLRAEVERWYGRPPPDRAEFLAELRKRGWSDDDLGDAARASPAPAEELPAAAGGDP